MEPFGWGLLALAVFLVVSLVGIVIKDRLRGRSTPERPAGVRPIDARALRSRSQAEGTMHVRDQPFTGGP
ncbi:hypothetical protein [Actinoalloteichus hymeniacidonis]|uniref:Uncharacterized protein n=1 Tax=Actinoalloteichus hymeniacidonis TaxID=340345 RepID=A0AAC9HMZ2_9PSEU|nr:hypothetical protein [Actinoalloteichus hymeniacidonis]AOS62152.1 hypothetical protein TL08_06640 [Actinoalloteichus hymeniacidonis]MBB5909826.1 hypothetical protein [Actinoalloteichus hymeniacidonis]